MIRVAGCTCYVDFGLLDVLGGCMCMVSVSALGLPSLR